MNGGLKVLRKGKKSQFVFDFTKNAQLIKKTKIYRILEILSQVIFTWGDIMQNII